MKKLIVIIGVLIAIVLAAAIIIPIVFKDEIKAEIDKVIAESVDANVYYNPDEFGLTLFKSFPNPTISLKNFGVANTGVFAGDTLVDVGEFNITVDLFSLFGDKITINSINLIDLNANVKVLENGAANYDIAKDSGTEEVAAEEDTSASSSAFAMGIDKWVIENANIIYDDRTMPFFLSVKGLNHEGSGDITLDVYDVKTKTSIEALVVDFDNTKYLNGQQLNADLTLNIDLANMKFTFKENNLKLNDLAFGFDGYLAMPDENMDMDITFNADNNSIKGLYSLIPGVYTEGFEDIKAEGLLSLNGRIHGKMTDELLPAFNVSIKAENGMIQYPDLPSALRNIAMDVQAESKDGNIDYMTIDVNKFHVDFGSNPVDMQMKLKNLVNYDMDAKLNARLNLAELGQMFPIEGLEMKGMFAIDASASGIYDSIKNTIPSIDAAMSMKDGYIKSVEFPTPLEQMGFEASVKCPTGKMPDGVMEVKNFNMTMGDEKFEAALMVKNFVDYTWDLMAKGGIDLAVISEAFPVEDMKYKGKIKADISTKGKYSDVEAERYDKLPTSGSAVLSDFLLESPDIPGGFAISTANMTFNPQNIVLSKFEGQVGNTDLHVTGKITNYIAYVFEENALLTGSMRLQSNLLDVNQFMTSEDAEASGTEETAGDTTSTEMEVIEIPKNIDFEFTSDIKKILYDNLTLSNAKGMLVVRDGVLNMDDLGFDLLGGHVVMNGFYSTNVPSRPAYGYRLKIQSMSIPDTYSSFNTVQAFAPFAQNMDGNFSTDFQIGGLLGKDMMPLMETVTGAGLIQIAEATVKNSKLVSGITSLTKLNSDGDEKMTLKDVALNASIKDGRAHVQPFDVAFGKNNANLAGSIGIDGTLDYVVKTDLDAGAAGAAFNSFVSSLTGGAGNGGSSRVKLNFAVGGTYDDMKIRPLGAEPGEGTAKQMVKGEVEQVKQEVKKEVAQTTEKAKEQVKEEATKVVDSLAKDLANDPSKALDNAQKNAEEAVKKLDNVSKEDADNAKKELDNQLNKFLKKK